MSQVPSFQVNSSAMRRGSLLQRRKPNLLLECHVWFSASVILSSEHYADCLCARVCMSGAGRLRCRRAFEQICIKYSTKDLVCALRVPPLKKLDGFNNIAARQIWSLSRTRVRDRVIYPARDGGTKIIPALARRAHVEKLTGTTLVISTGREESARAIKMQIRRKISLTRQRARL